MKLVADECIESTIINTLRQQGHSVLYITELKPGATDSEVLKLALQENAILVTADKDFGEIVFRQRKASSGVILLRLHGLSSIVKVRIIGKAIDQYGKEMGRSFTVITPSSVRISKSL